jgi:ribonuclease HI
MGMAIEENDVMNNPKTRMLEMWRWKCIKNVWVPGHEEIAGNEQADVEAITAFEDTLHPTERIPPQAK